MRDTGLLNAFDDCIDQLAHGQSVEDCLRAHPRHAAQLRPMLEAGLLVKRAQPTVVEIAQAQERGRFRYAQAVRVLNGTGRRPHTGIRRAATFAASLAALLALVVGVFALFEQRDRLQAFIQTQTAEALAQTQTAEAPTQAASPSATPTTTTTATLTATVTPTATHTPTSRPTATRTHTPTLIPPPAVQAQPLSVTALPVSNEIILPQDEGDVSNPPDVSGDDNSGHGGGDDDDDNRGHGGGDDDDDDDDDNSDHSGGDDDDDDDDNSDHGDGED